MTTRARRAVLFGATGLLYGAARLRAAVSGRRGGPAGVERVVCVSPSYFAEESLIGGGERYATELAAALAEHVDTTLVSFGPARRTLHREKLRVEVFATERLLAGSRFDPVSYAFRRALPPADVVHCFQHRIAVTGLAIAAARALGKPVFVTELGGAGVHFGARFALDALVTRFLPISRYAARAHPPERCSEPLYGGVSPALLAPPGRAEERRGVLFVGRLLPHKGVDTLIAALPDELPLEVVGRVQDAGYFALLQRAAQGKQVRFVTDAADD